MAKNEINETVAMSTDNAILLLAAAQELGLPAEVVATTSDGVFSVPQEVVDKAGLGEKPAKKAPAKRAPAKKAATKKAAATPAEAPKVEATEQKSE